MTGIVIGMVVAGVVALSPLAQAQSAQGVVAKGPGVVGVAKTVDVSATITAIDKKSRAVTLKGPEGREKTVTAGPEVKNFDQLKIGDQVDLQYVEALVLELKKGNTAVVGRTEQAAAGAAAPGSKPGAAVGRKVTVVGEVTEVNAATQTVTVRGPQRTIDLPVQDSEQFKLIAKGDKIQATYTEAMAVTVKPKK